VINALFGNIIWLIRGGGWVWGRRAAQEGLALFLAQKMPIYLI